jgi:hypothetical protein
MGRPRRATIGGFAEKSAFLASSVSADAGYRLTLGLPTSEAGAFTGRRCRVAPQVIGRSGARTALAYLLSPPPMISAVPA